MKIAYLISAYSDPEHLGRLIASLNDSESHFFIHVDKKVDQQPFMEICGSMGDRITFIKDRKIVRWGGFSQVQYQLVLLAEALSDPTHFDRFFLLSGSDYPLVSTLRIREVLSKDINYQFMKAFNLSELNSKEVNRRITRTHLLDTFLIHRLVSKVFIALVRLISAAFPKDRRVEIDGVKRDVYVGSSYFCITRSLAIYILEVVRRNPRLLSYFSSAFVPEEMLIQTIAFNSNFQVKEDGLTPSRGLPDLSATHFFQYLDEVKVCTDEDFVALINSEKLFGRKFVSGISDSVIARLDDVRLVRQGTAEEQGGVSTERRWTK